MPRSSGDLAPLVVIQVGSDEVWANLSNVLVCDDSYTTVVLSVLSATSNALVVSDFALDTLPGLPGSGRLLGFEVSVQWFDNGDSACDLFVLTQSGVQIPGSDNKADPAVAIPNTETTTVFGSSTDLWNTGLVFVEDMDGANFGIRMGFTHRSGGNVTISIDCVLIDIFFEDTLGPFPRPARRVRRIHHINRRIPG